MDDPQIIKSPSGDELVVLPRHEYEALVEALAEAEEELADIATLDARKAELAKSANADLPAEVSAFLLTGNSRITAVRLWRQVQFSTLARDVGLTEAELAKIEKTGVSDDASVTAKIATSLNVPADWISP